MRERLNQLIGATAYDVTISTYHAFGSELIRRWPDYFLQLSDMEPVNDLGIDQIFREIIGELPYTNPLKYSDNYIKEVQTIISDAKRALLTPDDLLAVAEQNQTFLDQANPVTAQCLEAVSRMDKTVIPHFARLGKELRSLITDKSPVGRVTPLAQLTVQELDTAVAEAETLGKQTPLTAWKNKWLEKDVQNHFVLSSKKAQQKLRAVAEVYRRYLAELQARELYDYDDMILQAVAALQSHDDFRYSLQERYLYILLDEFQDTNGAQFRLVELLTDNPVNEGRPNVLAVGDDDQAIYAFQGANYSNMLQFQQTYRDVALVPLTQNYRSQPAILHTARGIAEQIESRLHHHFPQIEKTLTAEARAKKTSILERREAQSDVEQFAWVTDRIKQLHAKSMPLREIAILAPQHKYLEPMVAFLQQAGLPLRYEKRENILDDPTVSELLSMAELALAIDKQPELADSLWPQILSYRCWNLPTSLIWQMSWQAQDDKQHWSDVLLGNEVTRSIALFFIRLGQLTASEPLEVALDYLIGVSELELLEADGPDAYCSPFYEYHFGQPLKAASLTQQVAAEKPTASFGTFWRLLSHLTVLRAHLRDYQHGRSETLKLDDLIEFVAAHRAADIKILDTSPYQEADDAVQLMTTFKSKGQEFEAVFVLACNDDVWGSSTRTQSNRLTLPANLQFIRYGGATNDERLRLFYVALTRAKSHLYLVNYTTTYSGRTATRLRYLDERRDEQNRLISPLLPEKQQLVLPASDGTLPPEAAELTAYWLQRHRAALSEQSLKSLLRTRLQDYQLSPTDIGSFIDLVHSGPEDFLLERLLRFPRSPAPEMQYGQAIHDTLQWIHLQNKATGKLPSLKAAHSRFQSRLVRMPLSGQQQDQFEHRGKTALSAYLAQRADTIAPGNECEYNFRGEGVFVGKAHMSGKIDKLIVDQKNKQLTIVDYKTGKAHHRWQRDIKLHKYRQQLYLYKSLAERSHSFAGYKVVDAYVEFVEPDEEGMIQELHLHLDSQEQQTIEQLAQAVWQCIQSLTFPDTTSYKSDLSGVETFEQWLANIPE